MKLSGREAARFCARPDLSILGVLLHGPDAGLIAARRREVVAAAMEGEIDDLRLTDVAAADARKNAAAIDEALKARGFFPGRRVVTILGGTDGLSKPLGGVLEDVTAEDALLVVTADVLPARSSLRKLFEGHGQLMSLQFFDDGMAPEDIGDALAAAGLRHGVTRDAMGLLNGIIRDMDHGSALRLIETIAIYGLNREEPLDEVEIALVAPVGLDTDVDRFVEATAGGRADQIGPLLRKLAASGVQPVALVLALQRHFRQLFRIATDGRGADAAIAALRPPVWGPRRDALASQARRWSGARVEQAVRLLFETDKRIRSAGRPPEMALVERCGLRLAIMAGR